MSNKWIPRDYIDRILKRYYTAHETSFLIHRFSEGGNSSPNLYGERINKTYDIPIECLGYIETSPTDLQVQELGWEKEMPEVIVKTPFILLAEAGLGLPEGDILVTVDDLLEVPSVDVLYKVAVVDGEEPFINGVPTYVCIGGRKFINGV